MSRGSSPTSPQSPQSRKERVNVVKDAAMAFIDADVNGDQELDFDEFHMLA